MSEESKEETKTKPEKTYPEIQTKATGVRCYDRAGEDEPLFVLRASDELAPTIVNYWANFAEAAGVNEEKVQGARAIATAMQEWPSRKQPD